MPISNARAVVVMINDPRATSRVISSIRQVAGNVPMFVRTNYLTEGQQFVSQGATAFVAGEERPVSSYWQERCVY